MEKFERIDGKYFIDGKSVDETVYISMLEEKANKKNNIINLPNINMDENGDFFCNEDSDELCEECQGILDLIFDLSEMNPEEAIDTFKTILYNAKHESFLEGLIIAYDNIGKLANKFSARMENKLEDINNGGYIEEYGN